MKKKIPLSILEALQPFADNNQELIKTVKDPNSLFNIIDKDENSDFYFRVTKQDVQSGGQRIYLTEYKPGCKDDVNAHSQWLELEGVSEKIKIWLELLQAYNKIHTIYDDPILKSNQERFEREFEILDSDANTSSFDLAQQIYLDDYLKKVKSKLLVLQEGRPDDQVKELEELAAEATEIQNNLTKETKRQIVKRLSKLWAKAQKVGLDVIREILVSVTVDEIKRLLTG